LVTEIDYGQTGDKIKIPLSIRLLKAKVTVKRFPDFGFLCSFSISIAAGSQKFRGEMTLLPEQ